MHLSTPKELWKIQYQRAKNIWPTQAASQNWSGLHMMQPGQAWCHCGPWFLLTDNWHLTSHPAGYLDLVHHCTEAAKTTPAVVRDKRKCHCSRHSSFKRLPQEIYHLFFEHLTHSAKLVPNRTTWHKCFSWAHLSTEMIETFWGGKEDASLARNQFLGCLETLKLVQKG